MGKEKRFLKKNLIEVVVVVDLLLRLKRRS
jgi:hypothetical protein